MQVYESVDFIRWSRPEGRLYVLAKRGSRDPRKLLWMAQPPLPAYFKHQSFNVLNPAHEP